MTRDDVEPTMRLSTGTDVLACIHDLIMDLQAKGHTIELLDDDRRRRGMGWLWWGSSWRSSRL